MARGFDLLAPVYDQLAWLVFGKSIERSQCHFFGTVRDVESALVVGGGTGRFFNAYVQQHPESLLVYVEKSPAMLAKARLRKTAGMNIRFVESDFRHYGEAGSYELVLLPFFLDMFTNESVKDMVRILGRVSSQHTQVIVTDFVHQEKRGWKSLLIKGMYFFFRLTCDIEAHRLPNWQQIFEKSGWNIKETATYAKGTIGTHLLVRGN